MGTMEKESEVMHWADQAAKKTVELHGNKEKYTVAAGITPSGTIHIGNFREIITVDLVNRALISLGKKVRFIYSWDEFDVFRKVPVDAPKKELLEKFLRYPITEVPDTYDNKHKSYAEHNEKEVEETIPKVGINPEFVYQAKKYRNCDYAEEIKFVLDHKKDIKEILDKFRTEEHGENWWPVSVFCDNCKKDTTKVIDWDGKYNITYECKLCNHKETFDFRKKGIAKLPWRIDWPMRWKYETVDFEPGGKEHSTAGGSRDTAVAIFKHLYKKEPPVYIKYDFITIKGTGGKISKSLGNVISLKDTLEVYEPSIVRWLFAGTRPDTEFAISFDLDVIKLYEDFDKCERIYFGKEEADEKEKAKQSRIYELSILELPKKMPFQPSFRHLTNIFQIYEGDEKKVLDHYKEELKTDFDKERLKTRIICVKNWIAKYAPEDFKFKVNEKVPEDIIKSLSDAQKKSLKLLHEKLEKNEYSEDKLAEEFYMIMQATGLKTPEFFSACYRTIIGKEKGPRLANFVLVLGKKKVIKLLNQI
jgi:lysyl-tRNA synthetase class 1